MPKTDQVDLQVGGWGSQSLAITQAGVKVMGEQMTEWADSLESGIKRITTAVSKGATAVPTQKNNWHQKRGMGFQRLGMKRKTSFSVCFVHRQWKNSAPLCGSWCNTTRRICTDGILWNGHYSEWLDPFESLLIERRRFLMSQGSRMNQ